MTGGQERGQLTMRLASQGNAHCRRGQVVGVAGVTLVVAGVVGAPMMAGVALVMPARAGVVGPVGQAGLAGAVRVRRVVGRGIAVHSLGRPLSFCVWRGWRGWGVCGSVRCEPYSNTWLAKAVGDG